MLHEELFALHPSSFSFVKQSKDLLHNKNDKNNWWWINSLREGTLRKKKDTFQEWQNLQNEEFKELYQVAKSRQKLR